MTVSLNVQQTKEAIEIPRMLYRQPQDFFCSYQNTQQGVFALATLNDSYVYSCKDDDDYYYYYYNNTIKADVQHVTQYYVFNHVEST